MSSIKDLTGKIVSEGEAKRDVHIPTPDGLPLRIYKWWRKHTSKNITNENWCHYVRVIGLWAPLMVVRVGVDRLLSYMWTWIVLALSAVGLGVWLMASGIAPDLWKLALAFVVAIIFLFVLGGVVAAFQALFETRPVRCFGRWLRYGRLIRGRISPIAAVLMLAYAAVLAVTIIHSLWGVTVLFIATPIIVFAIVHYASKLGGYMYERQQQEWIAEREDLAFNDVELHFKLMYAYQHPPEDTDTYREGYLVWLSEFKQCIERRSDDPDMTWRNFKYSEYDSAWRNYVSQEVFEKALADYITGKRVPQLREKIQTIELESPSRFRKGLSYVKDFLILLAQTVRVIKWRACPLVEIPSDK